MGNKLVRKGLVLGIILLFIGTSITSSGEKTRPVTSEYHEVLVELVFVIGYVKNPFFNGKFNFQVINITVIGIFCADLGTFYFDKFQLNDSWAAWDMEYSGINQYRIIVNPPEKAFICGILTWGYFDAEY
jgi:hypothetical protein